MLIAVIATAVGFAFDAGAGKKDLTTAFAVLYVIGCVAAVLAVRQSALFTAVVQPPLVLFIAVPSAYYLFHSSEIHGIKDILINCGYPLIERFVLMFTTSVVVLLIGMARWYLGAANRRTRQETTTAEPDTAEAGPVAAVKAKVSTLFGGPTADDVADADAAAASLKHGIERPATARRSANSTSSARDRPTRRTAATRSRHARPPVDDLGAIHDEPPVEPRRSRRPSHTRGEFDPDDRAPRRAADRADRPARADRSARPERDDRDWQGADSEARPRRRPRTPRDPDLRTPPPRDYRRDPRDPRDLRDAREARDRLEPRERPSRRPNRYEQPESFEPYEPPRPRPSASGTPSTHHPVSKVRYRGSDAEDGDKHIEYRSQPRRARHSLDD